MMTRLRRFVKRLLPWWSVALGRRIAQAIYDLLRLRHL